MYADNRRVDHLHGGVMSAGQCAHDLGPDARSSPANEAIIASGVRAKVVWQVAPRCPRSQDPEDAIEDTTVVHPWHAARLVRQHRLDGSSTPSVRGLESRLNSEAQHVLPKGSLVAMHPKADLLCPHRVLSVMTRIGHSGGLNRPSASRRPEGADRPMYRCCRRTESRQPSFRPCARALA